jgi:hypothetical protein
MAKKKSTTDSYVIVTNKSYGSALKGIKIHYEGKKPKILRNDGTINFGKNILELLKKNFNKFQWIITQDTDEIKETYGITRVKTSIKTIQKMYQQFYSRGRDIKEDIIKNTFTIIYPKQFNFSKVSSYSPGLIASILKDNILNELSSDDKDAINKFLPDYIAKESVSSVNILKATTQIKTLKEIAAELKNEITRNRSESWWQNYIHKNILIIQQGYIHAIDKMNISIGNTKFPDFFLITHDGFLDILEIKKPATTLLKEDSSRNNNYWDSEIAKAIIQVENYIENISKHSDTIRSYIKDKLNIELKVVRPRGIILAGDSAKFTIQKQKDDFRLLSQSIKNINFLTYDELVTRLENYIEVLEKHSLKKK